MQTLIILWEPNARWRALDESERQAYVRGLDAAVNEARAQGVMTLGWSPVDRTLSKAPREGFVGVFAVSDAAQVHAFETYVEKVGWYDYFDSVNISINPDGGTNPTPSAEYARLLGMSI